MALRPAVLLFCAPLFPALGQTAPQRLHDHNLHAWLTYTGDHPVSQRWQLHLEGQWRRHDAGVRPQQAFVRPAVNFELSPALALSAGYAYVVTHRYGEYPVQFPFPEHRIYQQLTVNHRARRLELAHRMRTEQRWLDETPPASSEAAWRYQNRFRYMLRMVFPAGGKSWYFVSSNELFLNYAPLHGARAFDQNRAFVGIGRPAGKDTRIEIGYLQQTLLQRSARVLELNHTIQIGVLSRLPFGRVAGNRK